MDRMTNKERIHAVLKGKPTDRMPVHVSYRQLYQKDHFGELTGLPAHHYMKWLYSSHEEFAQTYRQINAAAPFDLLQPPARPSSLQRMRVRFVEKDGKPYLYNKDDDTWYPIRAFGKSGHAGEDETANQTQHVFSHRDIEDRIPIRNAGQRVKDGDIDGLLEVTESSGDTEFIVSGGVVGTVYGCGEWLGQTNVFYQMFDHPDLVEHLCKRLTDRNVEIIRALARAGGDAIYIDDAMATSDMISVASFETYCVPYMRQLVEEIHVQRHKAIIIYFGGVADRLEQIASIGADGLQVEASMKGYVNDIGLIAERIGGRISLFGNVNPYVHLQRMSDEELEEVMQAQASAGARARGFITSTGSPVTMRTELGRVRKFIEFGRTLETTHKHQREVHRHGDNS